jgi:single-strand DNA-binding protein
MNNWNFTGNLGRDAESRYTPSGDAVVSFSVAVKSGFGDKATTTWVNCAIWGKRGEAVAEYLKKGALVGVTGEVTLRPWNDKDGQERHSLDVRVNDLTLLGKKDQGEQNARPARSEKQTQTRSGDLEPDPFEDVPF